MNHKINQHEVKRLFVMLKILLLLVVVLITSLLLQNTNLKLHTAEEKAFVKTDTNFTNLWTAPSDWRMNRLSPEQKNLVKYGKELIVHTANYLGPKGSIAPLSNGMNCQNCHLEAGTRPWGNNYFGVEANYPKFRARSGTIEDQTKRVNDCFERSLNGKKPDSSSREMKAILAYLKWVGSDVPRKITPRGTGIFRLKELTRAADPEKGQFVYGQKCQTCHRANGEGQMTSGGNSYIYPPLWGPHSYNTGAGLYRISNFAGYVKYNMPLGASYDRPQLTDEESWDVAAFINSMPRPGKKSDKDWPDIAAKPFDHPFGPYADPFSEVQHKYGPYKPIKDWKQANKKNKH
jgi:thiosulfate dehydrogenase